jgi:glucose-1-phosphate thymidylyltransferase
MKGILLAGGAGTRLHPVTKAVSKQLLPVYDKPLVYYPLSALMLAGIRDVLVITTPHEQEAFKRLLGDGASFGLRIAWAAQPKPEGIAQALLLGREFLAGGPCTLALGDNLFYGHGLPDVLGHAVRSGPGATVFAYQVRDPERYGVVEFDATGRAVSLEEKPKAPRSRWAVTGLYVYDGDAPAIAAGYAWLDTGTNESLLQASQFVHALEERTGLKVACLEEIAWQQGWLDEAGVRRAADGMGKSAYGEYLRRRLEEGPRT